MHTRLLVLICWLYPGLAFAAWHKDEQAIMGTAVSVELWDTDAQHAKKCIADVMTEMRRIDQDMSPYKPDSQLTKLNNAAAQQPVKVSAELFNLIRTAIHFSEISNGIFDITFASVGYRYNYREHIKPTDAQIKADLDKIDYHHLILDDKTQTIRYAKAGVRIDLGGIAKGYAVDRGIEVLKTCGIDHAMVTAGGDTRIIGDRGGRPWMTGIRDPRNKEAAAVLIPLDDTAISTSGDYERYFIEKGKRYHHIIDPRTGKSAEACRSVSILAPTATMTDGLSKTVFILGPKKGLEFIEKLPDVDAIIIDAKGKLHYSAGLMPPPPATLNPAPATSPH